MNQKSNDHDRNGDGWVICPRRACRATHVLIGSTIPTYPGFLNKFHPLYSGVGIVPISTSHVASVRMLQVASLLPAYPSTRTSTISAGVLDCNQSCKWNDLYKSEAILSTSQTSMFPITSIIIHNLGTMVVYNIVWHLREGFTECSGWSLLK